MTEDKKLKEELFKEAVKEAALVVFDDQTNEIREEIVNDLWEILLGIQVNHRIYNDKHTWLVYSTLKKQANIISSKNNDLKDPVSSPKDWYKEFVYID